MIDFKPSQVVISAPPLTGTLGRVEREAAAAIIVLACARKGDTWCAVTWGDIRDLIAAEDKAGARRGFWLNPFIRPDFHDLVDKLFAEWSDGGDVEDDRLRSIQLTEAGLEALRRWVRPSAPTPAAEASPEDAVARAFLEDDIVARGDS